MIKGETKTQTQEANQLIQEMESVATQKPNPLLRFLFNTCAFCVGGASVHAGCIVTGLVMLFAPEAIDQLGGEKDTALLLGGTIDLTAAVVSTKLIGAKLDDSAKLKMFGMSAAGVLLMMAVHLYNDTSITPHTIRPDLCLQHAALDYKTCQL